MARVRPLQLAGRSKPLSFSRNHVSVRWWRPQPEGSVPVLCKRFGLAHPAQLLRQRSGSSV